MNDVSAVEELVIANRMLTVHGVLDGFGHVSVRHPEAPDHFLLARSMAPALVCRDDIVTYRSDGLPAGAEARRGYLEIFIHSEIYRSRTDVFAIVHSHSPTVIPFSVVKNAPLQPVYHMAAFLKNRVPIFDIREFAADGTDLLIRTPELGVGLSRCLDLESVVLMRGHGVTVVGSSLRQAVFRAVYLEKNAEIQMRAMQLGKVHFLSEAEAGAAALANDSQIDRAWDLWCHEIDRYGQRA